MLSAVIVMSDGIGHTDMTDGQGESNKKSCGVATRLTTKTASLRWSCLLCAPRYPSLLCPGGGLVMLAIDIVLYLLLTIWLDNILPTGQQIHAYCLHDFVYF